MRAFIIWRCVVAIIGTVVVSHPVAAGDEAAKLKAEMLYKDVYGPEHEKVAAGPPAARIAFAKKLLGAAGQVADDPALKSVILSKALKIASATPGGVKTALDIHAEIAGDPKMKAEHLGELPILLEKAYVAEPPPGKPKMALDMVAAYRDWAAEQCRRGDAGAMKSLLRARDIARSALATAPNIKTLLQEIDEQAKYIDKNLQQNKEMARFNDLLENDPKNIEAHVGVALIDVKNGQPKKAGERLSTINVAEIAALGKALSTPSSTSLERAEAAAFAVPAVTTPAHKAALLELARQHYEETLPTGSFNSQVARQYVNLLISLLAYESNQAAKIKTAERLAGLAIGVAEDALQNNDADKASQVLADARATCKRYPGLQPALAELDSFEKDFRARLENERERLKLTDILKKDPTDAKANWAMALALLKDSRAAEAAPYLTRNDKPDIRQLGALIGSKASEFEKAEAFRTASSGLPNGDKTAFLICARDFYEQFAEKFPDAPEATRAKLFAQQLGDGLPRKEAPLPAGVVALLSPTKCQQLLKLLNEKGTGDGIFSLDSTVHFNNPQSVRLTPVYRGMHVIPNWKYTIAENPQNGQYRYIAFSWKKQGGAKAALFLGAGDGWKFYGAGVEFEGRLMVSKSVPSEWTVVVRDLYKDFGPITISGMSLNCDDGTAIYFDGIYLGRTEADVRKAINRRTRN